MKRLTNAIQIMIVLVFMVSLSACGNGDIDDFSGTYKSVIDDTEIVLKSDNTAHLLLGNQSEQMEWADIGDSKIILSKGTSDFVCSITGDYLILLDGSEIPLSGEVSGKRDIEGTLSILKGENGEKQEYLSFNKDGTLIHGKGEKSWQMEYELFGDLAVIHDKGLDNYVLIGDESYLIPMENVMQKK